MRLGIICNTESRSTIQQVSMIVTAQPSSRLATFGRVSIERAVTTAMMTSEMPTIGTARNRNSARTVA